MGSKGNYPISAILDGPNAMASGMNEYDLFRAVKTILEKNYWDGNILELTAYFKIPHGKRSEVKKVSSWINAASDSDFKILTSPKDIDVRATSDACEIIYKRDDIELLVLGTDDTTFAEILKKAASKGKKTLVLSFREDSEHWNGIAKNFLNVRRYFENHMKI